MKGYCDCVLCGKRARTYCESDMAKLCWDCDQKVHGANFLVAKHSRCLLCHACQSPTPWKASGAKLLPTVSFCEDCVGIHSKSRDLDDELDNQHQLDDASSEDDDNDDGEYSSASDYKEDEYDDDGDSSEEEGDIQVVPFALDSASSPVHVLSCSHGEEEISSSGGATGVVNIGTGDLPFKRFRENSSNTNFSDDEIGGSSLQTLSMESPNSEVSSVTYLRPLKQTRTSDFRALTPNFNECYYT